MAQHFQKNAADQMHAMLALSRFGLRARDWMMRLLPQTLLARELGQRYDTERELVHQILGTAA
jgi:hypothetical protein